MVKAEQTSNFPPLIPTVEKESFQPTMSNMKGKALHELFHSDSIAIEEKKQSALATLFEQKINFWWFSPKTPPVQASNIPSEDDIRKAPPINSIPEIDHPGFFQEASLEGVVPKLATRSQEKADISSETMMKTLALMETKTMDQVMLIVLKAQLEVERDNAEISQNSFEQLQNQRKIQEKALEDIKAALRKDEKIGSYLDTAQNLAISAAAVCAFATLFATVVASAGFSVPFGIAAVTKLGTFFSGAFTAFSHGGKGYITVRSNEHKASLASHKHDMELTKGWTDDYRETMGAIAETDAYFKEMLIKLVKSLEKMRKNISTT
jgi:hypothetical protein